ncbi:MAG: biotin carboxylase [Spirochaetae bacterium HGW-Spirochaetae-10]|nr:MAG: biotin carboxylase [Spirochaetae bacterium HGW-Spirochaetae-10]
MSEKTIRYLKETSPFIRSFACNHVSILIVCRGPIRKEAMDVFDSLGVRYGILLSEKDSVTYPVTLAPEIRQIPDQNRVHRIPDYTGANREERLQRIDNIIQICKVNSYTHIFAGYGFMAEDAEFVESIEKAGLGFVGPAARVHHSLGAKDQAKKLARKVGVSVTPGLDNITSVAFLAKAGGSLDGMLKLAKEQGVNPDMSVIDACETLEEKAELILEAGYHKGVGLISTEELQEQARKEVDRILKENPGRRIRLKYIGGGGGKGQRIVSSADEVPGMALEVLAESKALGPADNKNFLIEMNIENTRHNEIQLIGNGKWAIALGGRDCSVQMYEQKLVELSITDELYAAEIERMRSAGKESWAKSMEADRGMLREMEMQAERLAETVGLNSASTFECIVSGHSFYFMEVNTRIQVEHRVTEMVYGLRFRNPENPAEYFDVESLVEAMVLCAAHGEKLPRPERYLRSPAGGEVRLNAMNDALQPHAGGVIEFWSNPIEHEIRDDQGISIRNPDTGAFIHYHLAGAYDSNIALIVTYGKDRNENLERLGNILRSMELRGTDLATNREFHMGLIYFLLGLDGMARPDTKFAVPYLAAAGNLAAESNLIDVEYAWSSYAKWAVKTYGADASSVVGAKMTLISRPIEHLLHSPHLLAGWLGYHRKRTYEIVNGKVRWLRNPLQLLEELYQYLHLEWRDAPPLQRIWEYDRQLLDQGLQFYADLQSRIDSSFAADFTALDEAIRGGKLPGVDGSLIAAVQAAHAGWQAGLELLQLPILAGMRSNILDIVLDDDLNPVFPEKFLKPENQKAMIRNLAPPPAAAADTIVAPTGGMIYFRETPAHPPYVDTGDHFDAGKPIFIIEVMKMFNKIPAEFAGTIVEKLVHDDGVVVKKGQPIFRVKPDEEIIIETPAEKEAKRRKYTDEILSSLLS